MYKGKKVIQVVAVNAHNSIGLDGQLMWYVKGDLQHFKETTMGNVLIVGNTTMKGLPSVVNNGRHIITVSKSGLSLEQALDQAVEKANELNKSEIYVIGGASIYLQTSDITDEAIVSLIDNYEKGDTSYYVPEHLSEKRQDIRLDFTIFTYGV